MAKVLAVAANKGGVGKTSLVTNLAGAIVSKSPNKRVLIIDTDGQGNASIAFGVNPGALGKSIYDVFTQEASVAQATIQAVIGIDLLPSNQDMSVWEMEVLSRMSQQTSPFTILKSLIDPIRNQYDYILIDTPPSLGLVTGNVLAAVDEIIIPFVPETFAVQGLVRVVETMRDFANRINPSLQLAGIVGVMVDQRTTLHSEMLQQARQYCTTHYLKMFETIIPRSIRFANSTAYAGKPATLSDRNNPIVSAYFDLLEEMFNND